MGQGTENNNTIIQQINKVTKIVSTCLNRKFYYLIHEKSQKCQF